MKVKIKRGCYVDGEPRKKGDIVDTKDGNLLIGSGQAEKYNEDKLKAKKSPLNKKEKEIETR